MTAICHNGASLAIRDLDPEAWPDDEFRYDDEEYRVYAELAGIEVCKVEVR